MNFFVDHAVLFALVCAGIAILYLVPLGGIFLYATGLLLLYFERLVDAVGLAHRFEEDG